MRLSVDTGVCIGSGQCVWVAADLFDQDEDTGLVILLREHPDPDAEGKAREAARACPTRAISVHEPRPA